MRLWNDITPGGEKRSYGRISEPVGEKIARLDHGEEEVCKSASSSS